MLEKDFKLTENKSLGSTSPERRRLAVKLQDAPNLRNKLNKKDLDINWEAKSVN